MLTSLLLVVILNFWTVLLTVSSLRAVSVSVQTPVLWHIPVAQSVFVE